MKIILDNLPTWRYHKKHGARLFWTQDEYDKAGAGWVDSPDKVNTPTKKTKEPNTPPESTAELPAKTPPLNMPEVNGVAEPEPAQKRKLRKKF
ncbi:MAG: hypothetical protein J7M24_00300 [Candidatus Latescibacteria bacterium]|nr:hypothetical protein [Candidatus Latescibacterota bacterium]